MSSKKLTILLLLVLCCFCKSSSESVADLLTSKEYTCWDARIGFGMCFCRDGKMYEYMFDDQAKTKRVKADYGDFIIRQLRWKIKDDSLLIFSGSFKEGYKIQRLTDSQLILLDARQTHGTEKLFYKKVDTPVAVDSLKQEGAE